MSTVDLEPFNFLLDFLFYQLTDWLLWLCSTGWGLLAQHYLVKVIFTVQFDYIEVVCATGKQFYIVEWRNLPIEDKWSVMIFQTSERVSSRVRPNGRRQPSHWCSFGWISNLSETDIQLRMQSFLLGQEAKISNFETHNILGSTCNYHWLVEWYLNFSIIGIVDQLVIWLSIGSG